MSDTFMDQLNRTPVTFGVLAVYLLLGVTTGVLEPDGQKLEDYGAAIGLLIMDGEPWRLVTHCFLHGGLLHLFFNSYALYVLGPPLEHHLGSLKFGILYLVAGIVGGVVGVWWHHSLGMLVGGSGALFGMMGAMLAIMLRSGRNILEAIHFHGTKQILGMIAINLVIGWIIPFISNAAQRIGTTSAIPTPVTPCTTPPEPAHHTSIVADRASHGPLTRAETSRAETSSSIAAEVSSCCLRSVDRGHSR